MGRYRKIDSRIWNDEIFCSFSDNGKLTFLFLLTHPNMTSLGAMRASIPGLAAELGWTEKAFREAFREPLAKGRIKVDERASCVMLPNFLKYNPPENPNVVKSWIGSLDLIPECNLKAQVIEIAQRKVGSLSEAFREAFREAFDKPFRIPEQEPEQEPKEDISLVRKSESLAHVEGSQNGQGLRKQPAFLLTKRKRKLTGVLLDWFEEFWATFSHKLGKSEAADAWLDLIWPEEADKAAALFQRILAGARREAQKRPGLIQAGRTPKMAQGWISGARWEDEPTGIPLTTQIPTCGICAEKDPGKRQAHLLTFASEEELKQHFSETLSADAAQQRFLSNLGWWRTSQQIRQRERSSL